MSDRAALLAAIRSQPGEDTPRLVLADWLDEFGTTDQDAARAEFIRLSCTSGRNKATGAKVRIGVKEGQWLDANWKRLLPTLLAHCTPQKPGTGGLRPIERKGAVLAVRWHFAYPRYPTQNADFGARVELRYWKGFATLFSVSSPSNILRCGGLVRADEPLARAEVREWPFVVEQSEAGVTLAYGFRKMYLGPLYDLIRGYDFEQPGDAMTYQSKIFAVTEGDTDPDETVVRAGAAFGAATRDWLAANVGRGFERTWAGGTEEAVYPIRYTDHHWEDAAT